MNIKTLFALLPLIALAACVSDAPQKEPDVPTAPMMLSLTMTVPKSESTRAVTTSDKETYINDAVIMIFERNEADPDARRFVTAVQATTPEVIDNSSPETYMVRLKAKLDVPQDVPNGIYDCEVLANVTNVITNITTLLTNLKALNEDGSRKTYGQLKSNFVINTAQAVYAGNAQTMALKYYMPMYGKTTLDYFRGLARQETGLQLTRALAKIQVVVPERVWNTGSPAVYVPSYMYSYKFSNQFSLIPDKAKLEAGLPTIPEGCTLYDTWYSTKGGSTSSGYPYNYVGFTTVGKDKVATMYFPETDVKRTADGFIGDENHLERFCILIQGTYKGQGYNIYRIDLKKEATPPADAPEGRKYYDPVDIIRNTNYRIEITNVYGSGDYNHWWNAYATRNSRMEATIEPWTEEMHYQAIDGGHWISVDSRQLLFGAGEAMEQALFVRSNVAISEWDIDFVGDNTTESVTTTAESTANQRIGQYFSVERPTTPAVPTTGVNMVVKTRTALTITTPRKERLRLRAGKATLYIDLKQSLLPVTPWKDGIDFNKYL